VALVPAAGMGRRFGGTAVKQLATIRGRTLIQWSLERLRQGGVERFVVAVPEGDRDRLAGTLDEGRTVVVDGGATRQESVERCLRASDAAADDLVLVHDAARAAVAPADVRAVIAAAGIDRGAVLGRPVSDTLKRVDSTVIVETVDRRGLFRAETPQVFPRRLLERAIERARIDGFVGTDESSLVERLPGVTVAVSATRPNPKVTWPGDLEVVAALLQEDA